MTPQERAAMRNVLRDAVGRAKLPAADPTHPGAFVPAGNEIADVVSRFRAELTALGGIVHDAQTVDEVAEIVAGALPPGAAPAVLMWDDGQLPLPGLSGRITAAGLRVFTETPATAHSRPHRAEWASAAIGITGAEAGLAQTGSLVLVSGPGRGRLVSLLPPVHVALLERRRLKHSLPVLLTERPDLVTAGANFVCITGPSRTADIEHTLTRGVHGPGHVHVILLP